MPPTETFLLFTRRFGELGVRYMVSGSIAGTDLRDIKGMLTSFGEDWDRTTLEEMVLEGKLAEEWEQAKEYGE